MKWVRRHSYRADSDCRRFTISAAKIQGTPMYALWDRGQRVECSEDVSELKQMAKNIRADP